MQAEQIAGDEQTAKQQSEQDRAEPEIQQTSSSSLAQPENQPENQETNWSPG